MIFPPEVDFQRAFVPDLDLNRPNQLYRMSDINRGTLVKALILAATALLTTSAFAKNEFQKFNGSYEIVDQDCVAQRLPDGRCSSTIYATEVNISGDSQEGQIHILNPSGGFGVDRIQDAGSYTDVDGSTYRITWSLSNGITTHQILWDFGNEYYSGSWSLEQTARGLKLTNSVSGMIKKGDPDVEHKEFVLYLKAK